jgi:hypothetical protein
MTSEQRGQRALGGVQWVMGMEIVKKLLHYSRISIVKRHMIFSIYFKSFPARQK